MKKYIALAGVLTLCLSTPALANKNQKGMGDHYFNKMDTNGDGVVTHREHAVFSDSMFDECDTNNDGTISRAEMHAHHKHMHKNHRGTPTSDGPDTNKEVKTNKGAMKDERSE